MHIYLKRIPLKSSNNTYIRYWDHKKAEIKAQWEIMCTRKRYTTQKSRKTKT